MFHRGARAHLDEMGSRRTSPVTPVARDDRLLLFLTSEIGRGATGVVHGGTLEIESEHRRSSVNIVAKLAFTSSQQARLAQEWSVYTHLALNGVQGIPTLLGIFHDVERDNGPSCVLMRHAGTSLRRASPISSVQRYVISHLPCGLYELYYSDAFLETLRSIHNAGILHNDLRIDNLLVSDTGTATIIDFDRAAMDANDNKKKEEYEGLLELLEQEVKKSVPVEEQEGPKRQPRSLNKAQEGSNAVVGNPIPVGDQKVLPSGMVLRPRLRH